MTAFDYFQESTVWIAEGRVIAAQQHLREAIAWIDRTGEDQHMRADLAALLATISTRTER